MSNIPVVYYAKKLHDYLPGVYSIKKDKESREIHFSIRMDSITESTKDISEKISEFEDEFDVNIQNITTEPSYQSYTVELEN